MTSTPPANEPLRVTVWDAKGGKHLFHVETAAGLFAACLDLARDDRLADGDATAIAGLFSTGHRWVQTDRWSFTTEVPGG